MEEKKKGKRSRETIKPKSNLDIDELLKSTKRTKISSENPIPEFKQMCHVAPNDVTTDAAVQLGAIIRANISGSSASGNGLEIALEQIRVMRSELVEQEVPEPYNEFMQDLKKRLTENGFVREGDGRLLWSKIVGSKLGLITKDEIKFSEFSEAEAAEVSDVFPVSVRFADLK